MSLSDEARVLIIYSGGTIGMLHSSRGYVTHPNYLYDSLRSTSRFHDPFSQSVFANSSSVESYARWSRSTSNSASNSRPTSPGPGPGPGPGTNQGPFRLTKSSATSFSDLRDADGTPARTRTGGKDPNLDEPQAEGEVHSLGVFTPEGLRDLPSLVTPKLSNGKRIRYAILEYVQLIDSSEIEPSDWIRIATDIETNYELFDAFVILHGTDTMAYTASALSFLLEDLGKTVILTGAQIPLSSLRNDASENLFGALTIAGSYLFPEVGLYFNNQLFRGNRTTKASSFDLDAFKSPNLPPLCSVGIDIEVAWDLVFRPKSIRKFQAQKVMSTNVATLRIFPGIRAATARAFLAPPIQGVVLETYGAGNAPQRKDLLDVFREASARGVIIVNISQCQRGSVTDAYETGRALAEAGVIGGRDMTAESALAKLGYLLAKPDLTTDQIRSLVATPIRGELSLPPRAPRYKPNAELEPDSRVSALLSQILQYAVPDADSPRKASRNASSNATTDGGTIQGPSLADVDAVEMALLPVLLAQAAIRDDSSLKNLLHSLEESLATKSATTNDRSESSEDPILPSRPSTQRRSNSLNSPPSLHQILNSLPPLTGGLSPLHLACLNGRTENVSLLLSHGCSVHLRDSTLDHTPLFYAAKMGFVDTVRVLVSAGAHLGRGEMERGEVGLEMRRAESMRDSVVILDENSNTRHWAEAGLDGWTETRADLAKAKEWLKRRE